MRRERGRPGPSQRSGRPRRPAGQLPDRIPYYGRRTPTEAHLTDDLRSRLERALSGTYDFERELGGGGMSRTYLAVERAFGRRVVVKVLAPDLAAGLSVERFRREVMLAARLQHPHIVPVHSAGEAAGLPWFSMPFVEGESLRHHLERGPLPTSEVVSILRDVARALTYAHQHGIVHRDIKPDNVLLSAGTATVTDFGIAKAIDEALTDSGARSETLTAAGTSLGTPAYMAPEQAAGDAGADHRADIYSFGVMAYELLAGQRPFQASSAARLLAAHMMETPPDLRQVSPGTPAALAALVAACLEKDPAARPQDASEVLKVLELASTSGASANAPAFLAGRRVRLGRAIAIWAAATVFVALLAWAATETIGLPDWVLPGSVTVMLAGLPVILLTAYIHRTVHRAYTATPGQTPGGTPSVQGTLATLAIRAAPHVSWRRTWMGGVAAVGAFIVLVTGFMATRALGIGPAASLRGTGEFAERETIVVADFRSPAGDSALGETVSEALRTDLDQSRNLDVLSRADLRDALGLMDRPAESRVPFQLAREIATREGAKAVLDGEVVQLGRSYVVSARLMAALDGRELASFRETANGENELVEALGRLSHSVRERAGESLRNIRATDDLERVTTPSLPALRKYVEGVRATDDEGDDPRAIALLQEAVELDTAFAMAWRKLGVLLNNMRAERARAVAATETAFRHRGRLTETERHLTEAYYYSEGPRPDHHRALAAYEAVLRLDSTNSTALNNAALLHASLRRWDRAEELNRRGIAVARPFPGSYSNLIDAQIRRGRLGAIDSTLVAFQKRYPSHPRIWEAQTIVALAHGNAEQAESIATAALDDERTDVEWAAAMASFMAAIRGRAHAATAFATRAREVALRRRSTAVERLGFSLDSAWIAAAVGQDVAGARAMVSAGLARNPPDSMDPAERPWLLLSTLAARIGDGALARVAAAGYVRDIAPATHDPQGFAALVNGRTAMAESRWDDAVRLLTEADRRMVAAPPELWPEIARAYHLAGRTDSAVAWYERALGERDSYGERAGAWLAPMHRWAAELYESQGEPRKAIEHYAAFAEQWKDADPELQPQVREVRARIARLGQELESGR